MFFKKDIIDNKSFLTSCTMKYTASPTKHLSKIFNLNLIKALDLTFDLQGIEEYKSS